MRDPANKVEFDVSLMSNSALSDSTCDFISGLKKKKKNNCTRFSKLCVSYINANVEF